MFRDEDSEVLEQFQELCWFKAVIPETSLIRMSPGGKKRRKKLLQSNNAKDYYVSNFQVVVSFGETEFKCYIEWKDEKGRTQTGPISPIWNDDPFPSAVDSRYHDPAISAPRPYEVSSIVYAGSNLSEQDSSSIMTLTASSNISTPTTVDFEVPEPYMQRDRERPPRLPYQQGLFGSSTTLEVAPFDSALPGLIQPSEIRDGVVLGGETGVQTLHL
ncbi:hypothetical protein FRC02_005136 [Tulasnella sp. 418]|nr:hypothetical protein FRC02_005136 [Tulasnella sp. 418]